MSNTPKQKQAEPSSLIARLRAKRLELQQSRTLELEIPGWDALLHVRYHPVSWPEVKRVSAKLEKAQKQNDPMAEVMFSVDLILAATECVLVEGKPYGDPAIGFDASLADLLGLDDVDPNNAQAIVLGTFPNDMALVKHAGEVTEWLTYEDAQVNEDLGKASDGTE